MSYSESNFLESLKTGFIDKNLASSLEFQPRLVVNDPRNEIRVLTTLEQELNRCSKFWFSTAFVTTSGVASIINTLKNLEELRIPGKVLASQYQNFTHPEALRRLLKFSNIELRISVDRNFHAKGYLFEFARSYGLIVGSSNLTANALSRNVEWNLKVSAKQESMLMQQTLNEFRSEFEKGAPVDWKFLQHYEAIFKEEKRSREKKQAGLLKVAETDQGNMGHLVRPNRMQKAALVNLDRIRKSGQNKALLVSATGTGKTFLSAFDAQNFKAKKLLFVVHRRNIAEAAMASFQEVFGTKRTYGLYSGQDRAPNSDYIFCTIQTLSRLEHLKKFGADHFDYIIVDESHRAGANSYQVIFKHFHPKFLLGMTATPERTDGFDIFKLFNHTIAYEIRLHQALEEDMLCPFHYYGVTDLTINGNVVDEKSDFNLLASTERVKRVLETAAFYGTDSGQVRGLVFCSRQDECISLATAFSKLGVPSVALTGNDSEEERVNAIHRLESDDPKLKIDYIFTVDIFNEGIDIPSVNQVIMLRPTQSAIIFVQQMGRGLRKTSNKDYLTIIDFIGNYNHNYLVPIALYGDNSYNKDRLRKLLKSGSNSIPGTSTISFDRISKERVFSAINSANMTLLKDLKKDYKLLRYQLGRAPMMMDFVEHGSRDPFLYVESKKSFYNFAESQEEDLKDSIPSRSKTLLEAFSKETNNGKRVEEPMLLKELLCNQLLDLNDFREVFRKKYGYQDESALSSAIHNLNLRFIRAKHKRTMLPLSEIYDHRTTVEEGSLVALDSNFDQLLDNSIFRKYLLDSTCYAISTYDQNFDQKKYFGGFIRYQKYSRKDVFRILGWKTNPVAQNVGGYIISDDKTNCPIFVTYHKADDISGSINYEDYFIDQRTFSWMSKSNRKLDSSDVQAIYNHDKLNMRIPLFIKKTDDEGQEFYYIGDAIPIKDTFEQTTIENDDGKKLPVVKLNFTLSHEVEEPIYNYFSQE